MSNDNILCAVEDIIKSRKKDMPEKSYVTSLFEAAPDSFLRKIAEEAGELILAAKNDDRENIIHETADLLFHALVLLGYYEIPLDDIFDELKRRHKA